MSNIQVQLRRGTTAQHGSFTGAQGEVTVDTDKNALVLHDGATAGGIQVARDAITATGSTTARSLEDRFADVINVLDFIPSSQHAAIKNGTSTYDATANIQSALTLQQSRATTADAGTGETAGSASVVFFPYGVYRTESTLNWNEEYGHIVGEEAILKKQGTFTGTACMQNNGSAFRMSIEGIQFMDYEKGLYLDSSNVNSGRLNIISCGFFGCTDYGLHLNAQSTVINIQDCIFRSNKHDIWIQDGDIVNINGGWFQREGNQLTDDYDGCIISNGNKTIMNGCLMVPQPETLALEPAWVKCTRDFYANDVRWGNEAAGLTAVNCFTEGNTGTQDSKFGVVLKNCIKTATGGGPAIRMFEIPNLLILEDNTGFAQSGATLIDWSSSRDATAQQTRIDNARSANFFGEYFYIKTTGVLMKNVASNLQEFVLGLNRGRYVDAGGNIDVVYEYNNPTVPSGDYFFKHSALSFDSSGNASGTRAEFYAECVASAGQTDFVFKVTPNANPTLVEVMRIKPSGSLNLANLPTSSSGLVSGDIWNNSGVLNIVP